MVSRRPVAISQSFTAEGSELVVGYSPVPLSGLDAQRGLVKFHKCVPCWKGNRLFPFAPHLTPCVFPQVAARAGHRHQGYQG